MNRKRKAIACFLVLEASKRSRLDSNFLVVNNAIGNSVCLLPALAGLLLTKDVHFKILNFYEEWVTHYIEADFFAHFRMGRKTMEKLLHEVGHTQNKVNLKEARSDGVPLEKGLMMTVWYLAKGESITSIADRFGIARSTCHEHIDTNIIALAKLIKKFIQWPSKQDCELISYQFMQISEYPGVVGAIDGCHINCKVPEEHQESYTNRKMGHSIVLQGICTPYNILTNICIGFPGSVHDARVLRESSLYKNIVTYGRDKYFYGDKYHLIGDSAYPCLEWLMTPYRDTGRLTVAQKKHNTTLSKARVKIENTYGLIKGRWRILKYVDVYSIEKIVQIITACCTLHNFCLLNFDLFEELDLFEESENVEENAEYFGTLPNTGVRKRDIICNSL